MKSNVHVLISLGLGAFLLLILFFPCPCSAGDAFPGLRVLISPLPGSLSGLPMEISFNGNSRREIPDGRTGFERVYGGSDWPDTASPVSPAGERTPARFQDYMLKYVTIGASVSGEEMLHAADPGVEGIASEKISFEVQAGLGDLSGALFIVLQL